MDMHDIVEGKADFGYFCPRRAAMSEWALLRARGFAGMPADPRAKASWAAGPLARALLPAPATAAAAALGLAALHGAALAAGSGLPLAAAAALAPAALWLGAGFNGAGRAWTSARLQGAGRLKAFESLCLRCAHGLASRAAIPFWAAGIPLRVATGSPSPKLERARASFILWRAGHAARAVELDGAPAALERAYYALAIHFLTSRLSGNPGWDAGLPEREAGRDPLNAREMELGGPLWDALRQPAEIIATELLAQMAMISLFKEWPAYRPQPSMPTCAELAGEVARGLLGQAELLPHSFQARLGSLRAVAEAGEIEAGIGAAPSSAPGRARL